MFLLQKLLKRGMYKFNNRIDLQNACHQLEQDCVAEMLCYALKRAVRNPHFKKEMYSLYTLLSSRVQQVTDRYNSIFEECNRSHHAPSSEIRIKSHRNSRKETTQKL